MSLDASFGEEEVLVVDLEVVVFRQQVEQAMERHRLLCAQGVWGDVLSIDQSCRRGMDQEVASAPLPLPPALWLQHIRLLAER